MAKQLPEYNFQEHIPGFITIPDGGQNRTKALNQYGQALGQGNCVSYASRYVDYSDLTENISSRPGLTREEYGAYRPHQRKPKTRGGILSAVNRAYEDIGLIRNVIDLMADFACQGIRLVHMNKGQEKFYQSWWNNVNGNDRSEAFLRYLYRDASAIPKITKFAKLTSRNQTELKRAVGSGEPVEKFKDLMDKKPSRGQIPWEYTFLNPATVELLGGQAALFTGDRRYGIRIPISIQSDLNKYQKEVKNPQKLSDEIKKAIKSNQIVPLDPETTQVFHYKKNDHDAWAKPIIYSILDDIYVLRALKLSDLAALDGAIYNIRLWTLGDLKEKIAPNAAAISKLSEILQSHTGVGTMDLIWGPDLKFTDSKTDVHNFLGKEKYEPTLMAIYMGLGIPPTLTGTFGASGTTNNFIALKTLMQRLEYGRDILVHFWTKEIIKVQKAMGFAKPAQIEFSLNNLGDENTEKALLIQMADRGLISEELLQHRFGHNADIEEARLKREQKQRSSGKRANKTGPYMDSDIDHALLKTVFQQGWVTPSQVGLELPEPQEGEKTFIEYKADQEAKLRQDNDQVPENTRGRPKMSKDKQKRKSKQFQPKTKADLAHFYVWLQEAQESVNDFLNDHILDLFGKANFRQLNLEQVYKAERLRFGVLFNLEPLGKITKETIFEALKAGPLPPLVKSDYQNTIKQVTQEYQQKLTLAQLRELQKYLCLKYKVDYGTN